MVDEDVQNSDGNSSLAALPALPLVSDTIEAQGEAVSNRLQGSVWDPSRLRDHKELSKSLGCI